MTSSKAPAQAFARPFAPRSRARRLAAADREQPDLERDGALMRSILDASSDCIKVLSLEGRVDFINAGCTRSMGLEAAAAKGASWPDLWSSEGRAGALAAILSARAGRVGRLQTWATIGTSEQRYWDVTVTPIADEAGHPIRLLVISRDATEQRRAEEALAQQGVILKLAQEAGRIGTFVWDFATNLVVGSDEYCRLWGVRVGQPIDGDVLAGLVHPDDRGKAGCFRPGEAADGTGYVEFRICKADTGEERWIAQRGVVARDAGGSLQRSLGTAYDVTDQKRAEHQKRLLLDEMSHRLKNMLTMVHAIAGQTLRDGVCSPHARTAFIERLTALGAAQDVLLKGGWTGANLDTVIAGVVGPHGGPQRFAIVGEDVHLPPNTVLALALALHELATNAVKYGALSTHRGSIRIGWVVARNREGARLRLTWSEHDGPAVEAPARRGFGTRLLKRAFSGEFGGNVTLDFRPDGLVCTVDTPLTAEAGS
jgi:PAS domain S-box-containing protein